MSYSDAANKAVAAIQRAIPYALRTLLERKHLYQSVAVPEAQAFLERVPPLPVPISMSLASLVSKTLAQRWIPQDPAYNPAAALFNRSTGAEDGLQFNLPHVKLYCTDSRCERVEPFNPVSATDFLERGPVLNPGPYTSSKGVIQCYTMSFLCQSCKSIPEVFLVRRQGLKLTLCGRMPIEHVSVPKVIPESVKKYYSDALVAHQSGQTLAGLFMLRTAIEQWLRPFFPQAAKMDDIWDLYHTTLGADFVGRFPSLRAVYGSLSDAIHRAQASAALFETAAREVEEHFDARRLFKLADPA